MAKKVALISCVSRKQPYPAPARQLYCSTWFIKAAAFAEQTSDDWFILSAKYGLLLPTTIIEPYNETLKMMPALQRRKWAGGVIQALRKYIEPGDEVIFLAGATYRENLVAPIQQLGCTVKVPMEGLAIGQQLSWLNHQLGEK